MIRLNQLVRSAVFATALAVSGVASAQDQAPTFADAMTASIDTRDAERFAKLWNASAGNPTATQLQDYISGGGRGVRIFTPNRIIDAANMAHQIAAHRDWYEQAISKCLPWVSAQNAQLRSIYLGLRGLLPEKPLPQIYVVVGGANSGGTADAGAQVLGLEILCRDGPTPDKFRDEMRTFFAHETAHTFQGGDSDLSPATNEPLLRQILAEGGADYVASLVTGLVPNANREAYGRAHEREMWIQFVKDRALSSEGYTEKKGYTRAGASAFSHWLFNADRGKLANWETDMGYWLGMQIVKAYVERAADPHAAIREALALDDPAEILRKSGYADKFKT